MSSQEFWEETGYRLLATDANGQLCVTDAFLRAQLARPELAPVASSCEAERALFESLQQAPMRLIAKDALAAVANPDVVENYRVWLRFRDRLTAKPTLEQSYLACLQAGINDIPPVLFNQLTAVLVRHVLGDDVQPLDARVAELFFRAQLITVTEEAAVLAADQETIESRAQNQGFDLMRLLQQGSAALQGDELAVLNPDNAAIYWARAAQHDTVIYLNRQNPAIKSLCTLMAKWVAHFLGVKIRVTALEKIVDKKWLWHLGLDAQASGILNDLYRGNPVVQARLKRIVCLFKIEFEDPSCVVARVRGKPVYMAMAHDEPRLLKLKPQNPLLNLPLAA
ncbi:MAG: DUF6352 family protein [Burkholderiaceae bacterium]